MFWVDGLGDCFGSIGGATHFLVLLLSAGGESMTSGLLLLVNIPVFSSSVDWISFPAILSSLLDPFHPLGFIEASVVDGLTHISECSFNLVFL